MTGEHTYPIDLKRMRAIVEVARAQSITTAAQTLGLTQSAVSRIVAEVEDVLGQQLFHRLPRGIQLTDAGELFVTRAARLLADVDDMMGEISESPNRVTGRLRLGVTATGTHAVTTIAEFGNRYPDMAVETTHDSEQNLCPQLLRGELDLVIGSTNYLKRWRELEIETLHRMHFAAMVRPDHPLTALNPPTEADVLAYPVILPEIVEPGYTDIGRRYAALGLPDLKPRYVSSNIFLILEFVRRTDAYFPVMHPSPKFGGLAKEFVLLKDIIQIPSHFFGFARANARPRTRAAAIFEAMLIEESSGTQARTTKRKQRADAVVA